MSSSIQKIILAETGASDCKAAEKIQDLWSGYGEIRRWHLTGAEAESVIVKHIQLPKGSRHPRGWNTGLSHQRKLRSYQVETCWYSNWSRESTAGCYVPRCYAVRQFEEETVMILEDLDASGFAGRRASLAPKAMRPCLKWLAHFHAVFMGRDPDGLWETGTYWHLATRPDELRALKDSGLRSAAPLIDEKLNACRFQTIVHGDAKLANFCFSADGQRVAAVDFQYTGGGCGMKDVAYFIGSCLNESDCEKHESELLDYYFSVLVNVLKARQPEIETDALVLEWRGLFPVAWADFHRFLKGWSPGHWKLNSYSEKISRSVVETLWN